MKKIIAMLLALMMVFALVACGEKAPADTGSEKPVDTGANQPADTGKTDTPDVPEKETIKIGHIVDLTGVEALTGKEYKEAVDFALELLDYKLGGYPVELIIGDAQNSSTGAADIAKKMVEEDGVSLIVGPTQMGQKVAVATYMKEAGVPLIFYNPTPPYLLMDNEWVAGANGGSPQMPSVMADFAYNELGYRKVHTITMDNSGGKAFIDPFVETFTALGGTVLEQRWTPMPCNDLAPYLMALDTDADALVAWNSGTDAMQIWQTWYELGLNEHMPILGTMHGGFTDYFIAESLAETHPEVADAMVGTYTAMMYAKDVSTPESEELLKAWVEKYGEEPRFVAAGSCSQAIFMLDEAFSTLDGEVTSEKLMDAVLAVDFVGPEGHTYFDGSAAASKDIHIMKVIKLEDGTFDHEYVKTYYDVPPTGLVIE